MTTPTADPNAVPVAQAVLPALLGQECTIVRDGYAEQLVVGFGTPVKGDWPLRETLRAPWLLYSRYGKWRVTDGVTQVASDEEPLTEVSLQRARAVLIHQHVTEVDFDAATNSLRLSFDNDALLQLLTDADSRRDEDAWNLETPAGLVIEAWPDTLTRRHRRRDTEKRSEAAFFHHLLRDVATRMGLHLYEPPARDDVGFDAILSAPNGVVVLIQLKTVGARPGATLSAVAARPDATPQTPLVFPLADLTADDMAKHVRHVLFAA